MRAISTQLAIGVATTISIAASAAVIATGQDNSGVVVCIGSDSILRSPASGVCPAGSRQSTLAGPALAGTPVVDESDPLGPTKNQEATLDQRLHQLEKRLDTLENAPLFEVVDDEGHVILSVASGSVGLYNRNDRKVVEMIATPEGGQFVATSDDQHTSTVLGAYGDRVGLRIEEGGVARLDLLKQPKGNYSLRIPSANGDIAGIGESQGGTGVLVIGDRAGNHRAAMQVDGGNGAMTIYNKAGQGVASLTQSANGGGLLVLANAGGSATVLMKSSSDNRYGVVMALPSGLPYVPKSGLPGSYMLGCAAGPACVPR